MVELKDSIDELIQLMEGDGNPKTFSEKFRQKARAELGLAPNAKLTQERMQLYREHLKEPRKDPYFEENKDIAALMEIDQKTRYFVACTVTPNMSGDSHTFADERFTSYGLRTHETKKIIETLEDYMGKTGTQLIIAHFAWQFKADNAFGIFRANESYPGVQETELVLKFRDSQVPMPQIKELYNLVQIKRNLELVEHFGLREKNWNLDEKYHPRKQQ